MIWLVAAFAWLAAMPVVCIGVGRLLARIGAIYDTPDPPDTEPENADWPEMALEEAA